MRLLTVLLLLLSYCSTGFTQNFTYSLSEKFKQKSFLGVTPLKSNSNGHYYVITSGTKYLVLTFFNTNIDFSVKSEKTYTFEEKEAGLNKLYTKDNMVHAIVVFHHKKTYNSTYYKYIFDFEGNLKEKTTLFTTDPNLKSTRIDRYILQSLDINNAPQGRRAFVWFKSDKKSGVSNLEVALLDADYKLISKREMEYPVSEDQLTMVSSSISSKGDIAFLYKEYPNSKKKEAVKNDGEMVAAYRLRLFEIGASAKKLEASTLRLTEGFAQTMDIFYDKSDALNICGFSSKTLKDDSDRIFAGKVGRDGNLSSVIQNKLSKTDIERINVARRKKSDKDADNGIDSDYLIKQVKLFEDGSYEVYLEEDYWFTTQVYNGKSYTTYYYYVTNMILRLRFTAVGNLEKMHILPKVATYGTPIYESYTAMENPRDDKDYFVYNMERTDMDDDVNKVPDRRGTGILNPEIVITSMSPSGELKREVLFYKEEKGKRLLLPSESESLGDGKYFLVIGEGKGLRLAFVSFK